MERLAIIDHNTHNLIVDEVSEETLAQYNGEEEDYIKAKYNLDFYSWDYITNGNEELFLFDKKVFTSEEEVNNISLQEAIELAEVEKSQRHVWRYDMRCSTFVADFNRGAINPEAYFIRIFKY